MDKVMIATKSQNTTSKNNKQKQKSFRWSKKI